MFYGRPTLSLLQNPKTLNRPAVQKNPKNRQTYRKHIIKKTKYHKIAFTTSTNRIPNKKQNEEQHVHPTECLTPTGAQRQGCNTEKLFFLKTENKK